MFAKRCLAPNKYEESCIEREFREKGMGSEEGGEHGVVIVGGGIVGLATALALHRKGIQSVVLEKSDSLRSGGAAISLFINAWRVLDQLGVGAELQTKAIPISERHDALLIQNKTQVTSCSKEAFRCLRRRDLIEALANELPVNSIRFGCQVEHIGEDPLTSFPAVYLDDGRTIKAKVLIGCDGSNSVIARSLGLKTLKIFPIYTVRGFTNYPDGHIYGSNGLRCRIGATVLGRIPVDDRLVFWFVEYQSSLQDSEVERVPESIRDKCLQLMKDFPAELVDMVRHSALDSLNFTRVRHRAPWDLLSKSHLRRGTTTVAGDAMHVMGPFIAQGGSCGLEDAIVLARCLSRELTSGMDGQELKKRVAVALDEYVKERRFRVMRLSAQTYLMGSMISTSSLTKRLVCILLLVVLFGGVSLHHTSYDCGTL